MTTADVSCRGVFVVGDALLVAATGVGDHRLRGGWGPSSDVLVAVKRVFCATVVGQVHVFSGAMEQKW